MKSSQKKIDKAPKDLLLGAIGEIGKLRDAVKWEEDAEVLRKFLKYDLDEVEDNIDDIYWLLALFASGNGVIFEEIVAKIAEKNKKRLPAKGAKSR